MLAANESAIEMAQLHSRSVLAGYEPARLFQAKVLVVGAGALGQNVAQDLALAGVGELAIVDFDRFEPHNATRSPLFPTAEEQARWGLGKAEVVGHKLRRLMTAPQPRVWYAPTAIQAVGDHPIAWADVVVSAVDSPSGRAYLAERCRLHRRAMVEGGFHGAGLNLALFGTEPEEPCYRCQHPDIVGAFSCTRYALAAEDEGIIPAIQNGAAVLAGLQAEVTVQWLHGDTSLRDHRVFVHIREMSMRTVEMARDPLCPAPHWNDTGEPVEVAVLPTEQLSALFAAVEDVVGPIEEIRLPDDLLMRIACTRCGEWTDARCPGWRWLLAPLCSACGGPFPRARGNGAWQEAAIRHRDQPEAGVLCVEAGVAPGATLEVVCRDGGRRLVRLPGSMCDLMTLVDA